MSLYLNVDGAKYPRLQDCEKQLRGLIHQARREWCDGEKRTSRSEKQMLVKDLDGIESFVTGKWKREHTKGLVVFSCTSKDFWHVFELPVAVPSALIIGNQPFAKTLTGVLDEYKRFCVVNVDRKKAEYFTVYLGDIEEHKGIYVDEWVPDKVKEGEWAGLRQSRIARHIEDHVMRHLKDAARFTYKFFLDHDFDRLIIAGHKESIPKFRAVLHPYLRERVVGEFQSEPDAPLSEILKKSLEVEKQVEKRDEENLLGKLKEEAHAGGLGVTGLEPTVAALMRGQAHILLIGDTFNAAGYVCYKDHFLAVASGDCPICGLKLSRADDLIEDMVQVAVNQNVRIEHIAHVPEFAAEEKIGALLRFAV